MSLPHSPPLTSISARRGSGKPRNMHVQHFYEYRMQTAPCLPMCMQMHVLVGVSGLTILRWQPCGSQAIPVLPPAGDVRDRADDGLVLARLSASYPDPPGPRRCGFRLFI